MRTIEGGVMETKRWDVGIYINEDGANTVARAVLFIDAEERAAGYGRARRNPADPEVPEIGDELAASRALADRQDACAVSPRTTSTASPPRRRRQRNPGCDRHGEGTRATPADVTGLRRAHCDWGDRSQSRPRMPAAIVSV